MKPIALLVPGIFAAMLFLFGACGGGQEPTIIPETEPVAPAGDSSAETAGNAESSIAGETDAGAADLVSRGQEIFAASFCSTCHTVEGVTKGRVGPDLTHIGTDGASQRPGLSAGEYIFESIRDPEAFVAEGVERAFAGTMTKDITDEYSDEEITALVAFLTAQK